MIAKVLRGRNGSPAHVASQLTQAAFAYRLGNRSALEWVIDQYQVCEGKRSGSASDPNRADDPQYIAWLVCRVVAISVETVKLVGALAAEVGPHLLTGELKRDGVHYGWRNARGVCLEWRIFTTQSTREMSCESVTFRRNG